MKQIKELFSLIAIFTLIFAIFTPVFADTDVNMGGVDSSVGSAATSAGFMWKGEFAQGIRVTAVDGSSGARIGDSLDYTRYTGGVDTSFTKKSKLEYITSPVLRGNLQSYTRTPPPDGMLTMLIGDDSSNNVEQLRDFFRKSSSLSSVIKDMSLSLTPEAFMEKGYKLIVEPVAYLTVDGKVTAVTATESAILSKRFDSGYVVFMKGTGYHPKGKPSNHIHVDIAWSDAKKAEAQKKINEAFLRDGYYCIDAMCDINPDFSECHNLPGNPYNWHLNSVVTRALPKSLFLQKADFGISPGNPPSGKISADEIIKTYGIGIISYKDVPIPDPLPPDEGDEDKPAGGYGYDFIANSVSIHTSPIREENDFNASAEFTYQQKIDCKYCITTCPQCGLTGRYQVMIAPGRWYHYGNCGIFSGKGCTCGMYYDPPVYETRLCHLCYVNCTHCDKGELWYESSLANEYSAPTKTATIDIFVDGATLDYTKGISGVLKYTKTMTFTADRPENIAVLLNAGEKIGNKDVVARINWSGKNSESNSNNNEARQNISVIPATNLTVEYVYPNAPFRAGTDVISSFIIHNEDDIGALNIRPKHKLTADFNAISPSGEIIDSVQMGGIVIPKSGTNLVYFKWHLPQDYTDTTVNLSCKINSSHSVKEMNYSDNSSSETNQTQVYEVFETPDTVFENRPKYFTLPAPYSQTPTKELAQNIVSSVSYQRWEWQNGDYYKKTYNLSLNADYLMVPDEKSPSRKQKDAKLWEMRSGYGVSLKVTPQLVGNLPDNAKTTVQNGNMYLPEYKYKYGKSAHRSLEQVENGLELFQNPNTIRRDGKQDFLRIHFVPLWFPDGEYRAKTYIYDLWSPVGMLSLTNDISQIEIIGDMYDDWYLAE